MSRGPCTFRQRDVTAAVKAVELAGKEVQRVEIGKDGKIILVTGAAPAAPVNDENESNEWDGAT